MKLSRNDAIEAWHFCAEDRRMRYGDEGAIAPGYVYEVPGPVRLCEWGLHASVNALDALYYAPGPIVCRVLLYGDVVESDDKVVATKREVVWMADATRTLHLFACDVAEGALRDAGVKTHASWKAIEVKRLWLDGKATDQALAAAREAAWAGAWAAVRGAAWGTAKDAAWDAARDAVRAAAWAAAWGAVRDAHEATLIAALEDLA